MNKLEMLNEKQREAVVCTEGPLLVLAGAGSGKTRVLTHRVAYLIQEKGVDPWNILAITFTNKAADEMKRRVEQLVPECAGMVWVSTFHSACVRILRRYGERLGYDRNFSIYDTDDQRTVMKQLFKDQKIDKRLFKERDVLSYISWAKNKLLTPEDCKKEAADFTEMKKAELYQSYEKELKQNNAMDFDDLLVNTVRLFQDFSEILASYQERFKYIMVDEYQDTNFAQFKLVELLAAKYRNLCVVGDDDQSIYKFRGADITNILNFESAFPGAKVVKLEQNYRSTGNILAAANEVIRHNQWRKDKTLWTAAEDGCQARFRQFDSAEEEAGYIAQTLKEKYQEGRDWKEMAVLYRTNAQSRLLEEACIRKDIPYLIVGGVNFYQRKEIKDVLAYLKTIANGVDDLAVARIINVPGRGIGAVTVGKLTVFASANNMNLYDAAKECRIVPGLARSAPKIQGFVELIEELRKTAEDPETSIPDLIEAVLEKTGYQEYLEEEGKVEGETRMENIRELISKAASYSQEAQEPSLSEFLEQVALVADIDRMDPEESRVTLMTLHSAKGLEFPVVFMAGMEDGLFPSSMATRSADQDDLEEERRLCYVGITRAREELIMTGARKRMVNGERQYSGTSRFITEIPDAYLEKETLKRADEDWDESGLPWSSEARRGRVSSFSPERDVYENPYAALSRSAGSSGESFGYGQGRKTSGPSLGQRSKTGPGFGKTFTVTKADHLDYQEGDRVRHKLFGEGQVVSIVNGKKDFEVTVNFDEAGTKKMFASFAKLEKV